jgi:hypothetical protein
LHWSLLVGTFGGCRTAIPPGARPEGTLGGLFGASVPLAGSMSYYETVPNRPPVT